MVITKIREGYQSLDSLVTRIGDAIPFRFKIEFELLPDEGSTLLKRHKTLQKVFKRHKPPIKIEKHMGSGGFADVFAATSDYNGVTDFAIKILREDLLRIRKGPQYNPEEEEMRIKEVKQRFKNESYVQWDLSKSVSENVASSVVQVYDHGEFDCEHEYRFILMERMDMTLREYMNSCEKTSDPKVLMCKARIMLKMAERISNVHQEGIFHRDIKPENILFPKGKSPRNLCYNRGETCPCDVDVRIGDFGTVRWVKSYTNKYDAVIIGSQFYMSPEQIFNPRTIDKRTDIYSFGIVCYELLYGEHPKEVNVHTTNVLEKLACRAIQPRTPPEGFERLHQIIIKCMKDRWSRYQSMDEVVVDLREFLEG
ncbi:MAG: serine/threonine protein kinase [Chitinispirillaceae bacterium]